MAVRAGVANAAIASEERMYMFFDRYDDNERNQRQRMTRENVSTSRYIMTTTLVYHTERPHHGSVTLSTPPSTTGHDTSHPKTKLSTQGECWG